MSEPSAHALRGQLSTEITVVSSVREFLDATRDNGTISFVDDTTLADLDGPSNTPTGPVVAICSGTLQTAVGWLPVYPWLSHVVSGSTLLLPTTKQHLKNVIASVSKETHPRLLDWIGPNAAGRRVRLAHANRRAERLERMTEFFKANAIGSRTAEMLRDVAEELLTNAFYDAPVAAGSVKHPISRTQDVSLPDASACNMVYGCIGDLALVRVRDPFGALTRSRLLDVLMRCSRTDMQVEVDETMGGAGLGLWRVFSVASFVGISVVAQHHTEVLVGIRKRGAINPRPFAFHLFFRGNEGRSRQWTPQDVSSGESVMIK